MRKSLWDRRPYPQAKQMAESSIDGWEWLRCVTSLEIGARSSHLMGASREAKADLLLSCSLQGAVMTGREP